MNTRHAKLSNHFGEMTIVATDEAITGLYFPGHWTRPDRSGFGSEIAVADDPLFSLADAELKSYAAGELSEFTAPVKTEGDEFQERIWRLLAEIPYGETTTYGALAAEVGVPAQARRVGAAVGHNPISILIPCHRVIAADGSLTGYAGGLELKRQLLTMEAPSGAEAGKLF
ncbi:MAG: methylated-DNA--[protein]-cysteine S-methyltransferase [Solirubrobacterales bacterium]|nr:methylated-DNA--[protein]-cysteine S-methyltransferase [Solirubrobacterales bacterium]